MFREMGYPEKIFNKETKRILGSSISSSNNKSKKDTQETKRDTVIRDI